MATRIRGDDAEMLGEPAQMATPAEWAIGPDRAIGDDAPMEQEERRSLTCLRVPDGDAIGLDGVFRNGDGKARRCHEVSPCAPAGASLYLLLHICIQAM